jgi:hypothetical protein
MKAISAKSVLGFGVFVLLVIAARCHNFEQVFVQGRVYFVDADCYSRMTRVRMILEAPGSIIRHHDFENYPRGITPHTTAPLDYLIAATKAVVDAGVCVANRLSSRIPQFDTLDLAGAFISPLLGIAAGVFLWFWSRRIRYRAMLLIVYAISPILVHGTALGRPDHQSLLIFLVALALGSEWSMLVRAARTWSIVGGLAWGFALWVSLYEPAVLLVAFLLFASLLEPRDFWSRERVWSFACLGVVLLLALIAEGWRIKPPDPLVSKYFGAWRREIGEMASLDAFSTLLVCWLGLGIVLAPVFLLLRSVRERQFAIWLPMLIATYALTLYQMRWGYFLALVFVMSLPRAVELVRNGVIAWTIFLASLWPLLGEWDQTLFPDQRRADQMAEEKTDRILLRDVAEHLRGAENLPFLAPWWLSPALAYWSGQNGVAGSSHESLPGTVDSAGFYLAEEPQQAREILFSRGVRRVVAYDPPRVVETSATLLGRPQPARALAGVLYFAPHSVPDFLALEYANASYKVFDAQP